MNSNENKSRLKLMYDMYHENILNAVVIVSNH